MLPQVPQLVGSVARLTHAPPHTSGLALGHAVQTPLTHAAPVRHVVPHAPQFFGSLLVSAQAAPQVIFPVGHAHTPRVQT